MSSRPLPAVSTSPSRHAQPRPRPVSHISFLRNIVRDLNRSQSFYTSVFGWSFNDPWPDARFEARAFTAGSGLSGGLHLPFLANNVDSSSTASKVMRYFMVDDIDEILVRVRDNGGRILGDITEPESEAHLEQEHSRLVEFEFDGVVHGLVKRRTSGKMSR
jgi:predicted enzyme related to lactoylglutathione lyase